MRKLTGTTGVLLLAIACGEAEPRIVARPEGLAVDRAEVEFGAIFVGGHYLHRVHVQNLGMDAVANVDVAAVPPGFKVSPASFTLAAQEKGVVEIRFFPDEARSFDGIVEFRARSAVVGVRVEGLGVPRAIDVATHLDFGDVKVGEEATIPLTLVSLTDAPLEVSIRNPTDFPFSVDREFFDLAPREAETIQVTFAPNGRGSAAKTFLLDLCMGCPFTYIEAKGNGVGKELAASPNPVGFGGVALGLTRRQQVTITNVGDFEVVFGAIEAVGDGFAVDLEGLPDRLSIGERASVGVSFTPWEEGYSYGALKVEDEDGTSVLEIPLVGSTGGSLLVVSPAEIGFGRRVIGLGSATADLRLENVLEPGEIDLVEARIEGADADSFRVLVAAPSPIEPRVDVQVVFDPGRTGELEAELVLLTTFPEQPMMRVPLTGSAVAPAICTLHVRERVRFGVVEASTGAQQDLVVRNDGEEPCPLWGFEVSGPDANAFSVWLPAQDPMVLGPGEALSMPVGLRRNAPMNRLLDASVRFTHSVVGDAPTSVPVSAWIVERTFLTVDRRAVDFEATPIDRATVGKVNLTRPVGGSVLPHISLVQSDSFRLFPGQTTIVHDSMAVEIVFEPKAEGFHAGELEVWLGFPEPMILRLGGEGVAACGGGPCDWPTVTCEANVDPAQWNRLRFSSTTAGIVRCGWLQGASDWFASIQASGPSCEATLQAPASGSYSGDLVAARADGRADLCTSTALVLAPGTGLFIELLPTFVASPGIALLHEAGGDPHSKPSWWDPASSCTLRDFWQTPTRCEWDEPGSHDDPAGIPAYASSSKFMLVNRPSTSHAYVVGLLGASLQPASAMTARIHCGGALAAERTIPLSQPHDFRILGVLTFQQDGSCELADDGLGWSSHGACLPNDPHCP